MTKSELIEQIARTMAMTEAWCDGLPMDMIVEQILEKMAITLERDERIEIRGFGSFRVTRCFKERVFNPRYGRWMEGKQSAKIRFKPSRTFQRQINAD